MIYSEFFRQCGYKKQLTAGFALIAKTGINKINMEWPIKVNYWPLPQTN